MKRAIIVHGWGGTPDEGWMPWLKIELEKSGFEVLVPVMPDTNNPTIEAWVSKLGEVVGEPDQETVLVGHSIGCQTVLRYLSGIDVSIAGAVLVAPWIGLVNLGNDEEWSVAKPWLETPIDFEAAKNHCSKFTLIFSDNDPFVPLELNQSTLTSSLNAKRVIVLHDKGHISGGDGVDKLPEALKEILEK